jgi:hypothetical protein
MVEAIVDAHLSSQEETILGGFLEGLAIFIAERVYGAHGKSSTTGIDLELDKDGRRYFVSIKSGPHWGNSTSIDKMMDHFMAAKRAYSQSRDALPVEFINGCCYGKQTRKSEHKDGYIKLCGQRFWEFVSGDKQLYIGIVEPIGHRARERNEAFLAQYEMVVDQFTEEFRQHFCDATNQINWDKLTKASSQDPAYKIAEG